MENIRTGRKLRREYSNHLRVRGFSFSVNTFEGGVLESSRSMTTRTRRRSYDTRGWSFRSARQPHVATPRRAERVEAPIVSEGRRP